ncbi:HAD-IC family P-type ATPase [Actinomyces culturomici]|uniref:HAD-IC family P-type ATPase n=1 Tax=Actinomyces culturomici TaxID=1926276 RepID=UPI000E203948|nr:HAD-IC family P-type ATPase [Actinomyces culturomici]
MTEPAMRGLTSNEARERVERGEANAVVSRTSRSVRSIVRENVLTLFNAILVGAAVLVLLFGHLQDVVFGGVMILNAIIGIVSELRAKRTLDALAIVDAPTATALRDGEQRVLRTDEVVLDDVLVLGLGDQICVDGDVLDSSGLEVDESLLTGESTPVKKKAGEPVLAGTSVVAGSARIVARKVGGATYAQDLARRARAYTRTVSQIQESIDRVLRVVSTLLVPIVLLTLWSQTRIAGDQGGWRGAIVLAVASVVGMIPQGLVLLTSLNFAIGSATLARRGVLVQELAAVEVLARVDALCVDKTGTLTTGRIRCREIRYADGPGECAPALAALVADRTNATAIAIADEVGAPDAGSPIDWAVPFSSARKWSALASGGTAWYLGAPEILGAGAPTPFDEIVAQAAGSGLRVVVLAKASDSGESEELPEAREVVGVAVLEEELRSDAAETLEYFRAQGVRVRVISGDNPVTVGALAQRAGLVNDGSDLVARDARDLPADTLSDEFARIVEETDVFGRVTPEQKRAMVQALQANGHCVAMTGDGVNDALALKDSDLGIAMGNGAQATKAVAQLVLVDSKFATLPGVVAEGRRIIANMERVSALFLAKTVYAALLVLACAVLALPYTFLPRHYTYIDAFTIGIPAFVLALAPNARRYVPGFLHRTLALAVPAGIALGGAALGAYLVVGPNTTGGRTAATLALMIGALWLLSVTARPLVGWRIGLLAAMAGAAVAGVLIPFIRTFFALETPTGPQWAAILVAGLVAGLVVELAHQLYHGRIHARAEAAGAAR